MTGGRSWGEYTGPFFKANSIWNKRLPDDVSIDPASALVVAALTDRSLPDRYPQVGLNGERAPYTGIAGFGFRAWTTPLHIAEEGNYTLQKVTLDQHNGFAGLQTAFNEVPIPDDTRPSTPWPGEVGGSGNNPGDNHLVIYQPDEMVDPVSGKTLPGDRMWEMWKARQYEIDGPSDNVQTHGTDPAILNAPGWHFVFGCMMENVQHNNGAHWDNNANHYGFGLGFGSAASKLPLIGGLVRQEEALAAAAGDDHAIQHALRLAVLQGATPGALLRRDGTSTIRWPGYGQGDGASQYTYSPAEGDIYRLPAGYNITEPDPFMRALQFAARDYGMITTDTAGSNEIYLEIRATVVGGRGTQPDIWLGSNNLGGPAGNGVFTDWNTTLLEYHFPWADLQLIDKAYRPDQPVKQRLIIGTP